MQTKEEYRKYQEEYRRSHGAKKQKSLPKYEKKNLKRREKYASKKVETKKESRGMDVCNFKTKIAYSGSYFSDIRF